MKTLIEKRFKESASVKRAFVKENGERIEKAAHRILKSFKAGGKIMIFGNGGSAADAQHMAAELVNRYIKDRRPLPAIALTTDSSILTSISNDTEFSEIFSKQVEALGRQEDIVIAITTSGNSPNVILGIEQAKRMGIYTIVMTGGDGGKVKTLADLTLCVSSTQETPRIQEVHLTLEHVLCEIVECSLFEGNNPPDEGEIGGKQ